MENEANLSVNQGQTLVSSPYYRLHLGPSSQTGLIRLVVYDHKEVSCKLRLDLKDPTLNSVWLEASVRNSKKILINQTYRERQRLGVADSIARPEQLLRWELYVSLWEQALNTNMETISMGDMNINHCNWMSPNIPRTNQTYKLHSLINLLFNKILPYGVVQMVEGPTHFFP